MWWWWSPRLPLLLSLVLVSCRRCVVVSLLAPVILPPSSWVAGLLLSKSLLAMKNEIRKRKKTYLGPKRRRRHLLGLFSFGLPPPRRLPVLSSSPRRVVEIGRA